MPRPTLTRLQATNVAHAAAVGWAWHRMRHRIFAQEVGFDWTGLGSPMDRQWRADLVTCRWRKEETAYTLWEVKGTKADLSREDTSTGKWSLDTGHQQVLVLGPGVAPPDDLPGHWGILAVDQNNWSVSMAKKPKPAKAGKKEMTVEELATLASIGCRSKWPWMGKCVHDAVVRLQDGMDESVAKMLWGADVSGV